MPLLGRRPIPARPVVLVALIGGSLLVAICLYLLLNSTFYFVDRGWVGMGRDEPAHPAPGWEVLRYYVPLVAWGPLVIAVAVDYGRRTLRGSPTPPPVIKRFRSGTGPDLTQTS